MIITKDGHEMLLERAVELAATPSAYSYEGQLEKLKCENEKLRELVARLIETAFGESSYRLSDVRKVAYILGYGYEVEE